MLCLTRKQKQSVDLYIDGKLLGSVMLVSIHDDGYKARIAFEFPPEVEIVRRELGTTHLKQRSGTLPGETQGD